MKEKLEQIRITNPELLEQCERSDCSEAVISSPSHKISDLPHQRELEELNMLKDTRQMRSSYAKKAFTIAKLTLIGWALITLLFFVCPSLLPGLDFKVYVTFTSACTVNILVAFHTVIKGLFAIEQNK